MKPKPIGLNRLAISTGLSLLFLFAGSMAGNAVTLHASVHALLFPLIRLLIFICIGLAAGQVIESAGWTRHLSVLARPFFRYSNLGNRCSTAFTAAFISGVAANAILVNFYQDNKISKAHVFLTNYINQLPAFFLHLPTTFFMVVPLTGKAGIIYFLLTFSAALLRTICFMIFGHIYPVLRRWNEEDQNITAEPAKEKKKQGIIEGIRIKLPGRFAGITTYVVPIYTLVFILNVNGFFDYINHALASHLKFSFIPVESLSVVMLSFAAEFTSGFAAAGALMSAGVLTTKQTVIALLLGNITAFPIRALRHQLPRYMGIFSPKMGLQLLLSGQFFRIVSIIIVGIIYYKVA